MAKLSSASIRLVQKLNRVNASGECPIYIIVCYRGRKEKSTGISCRVRDWNAQREVIKSTNSNSIVFNKILNDLKQKIINRKNAFELSGRVYNPSMLLEDSVEDLSANDNEYRVIYKRYLIDVDSMTLYVARHSKANDYLSHPGATIHGLATLLGRSVAGLDTYVHEIRNDRDLAYAESLSSI